MSIEAPVVGGMVFMPVEMVAFGLLCGAVGLIVGFIWALHTILSSDKQALWKKTNGKWKKETDIDTTNGC